MKKGLTQGQTDMKLANLITIFNMLYDKTPISRADLAKISGMSPTSITRFVNSMLKVDLLREMPSGEKKSRTYRYSAEHQRICFLFCGN